MPTPSGVLGTFAEGAATILGRLAQWFRLGRAGSIQPGIAPETARPRLDNPAEIVKAIADKRLQPTVQQGSRLSYAYICVWYDSNTGERLGQWRFQEEVPLGTAYQVVSGRVRAGANRNMPRCVRSAIQHGFSVRRQCKQLGKPIQINPEG